tara:strand:- start:3030 stop:3140 length:111 start_codon:yes stop_codon:yes gene_type:complete
MWIKKLRVGLADKKCLANKKFKSSGNIGNRRIQGDV